MCVLIGALVVQLLIYNDCSDITKQISQQSADLQNNLMLTLMWPPVLPPYGAQYKWPGQLPGPSQSLIGHMRSWGGWRRRWTYLLEFLLDLGGADDERAAHGVLQPQDVRVDVLHGHRLVLSHVGVLFVCSERTFNSQRTPRATQQPTDNCRSAYQLRCHGRHSPNQYHFFLHFSSLHSARP